MHDTSGQRFHVASDEGEWSGRTWTDRDLGSISDEIDGVASSQLDRFASQLGPEWIAQLIHRGLTAASPGPAPVRPKSVAPMPLPFVLPAEPMSCFTSVIEPWWNVLTLPSERDTPVAAAPLDLIGAKDVQLSFSTEFGGEFHADALAAEGAPAGAHLEVMDGWIALWGRRRFAMRSIDGPGFLGRFVPVYSHGRALASKASESFEDIVYGCRIPFEFIHSVRFDQWFFADEAPLAGSTHKRLLQERGYARPCQFRVRLNVHDGWTWHRLDLIGDGPHLDHEARLPEFLAWMVQWIAHHRAQEGDLTDDERDGLGRIASAEAGLDVTEQRIERNHCVSRTLLMPGARPVSVELAS